jgi:hypothetical protein
MNTKPTPRELIAAIHAKCLDCSGGSRKEVHDCKIRDCPLWLYRRGEPMEKQGRSKGQISVFDIEKRAGA